MYLSQFGLAQPRRAAKNERRKGQEDRQALWQYSKDSKNQQIAS